jgi:hypothetical protein
MITILHIIRRPVSYLKHDGSETEFYLRLGWNLLSWAQ